MPTLYQATLDLARVLGEVREGLATANGTTTTLTDTRNNTASGFYAGGTIWFLGATQFSRYISNHSGNTFTFDAASNPVYTGQSYAAAGPDFPRYLLVQAINAALKEIGPIPSEVEVAVTGALEYAETRDVLAVEVGYEVDGNESPALYHWTPHYRWRQAPIAPRKLLFDYGTQPTLTSTQKLRLVVMSEPAEVANDDDVITSYIHPDLLKWTAAVHAWRWRLRRINSDDPVTITMLNEAGQKMAAEQAQAMAEQAAAQAGEARGAQAQLMNRYLLQKSRSPRLARW